MTAIKICGVTSLDDAERALALGVDAIGVNFWSASKRRCELDVARAIAERAAGRARVVAVFVDATYQEIARVRSETGIAWAQLHGDEPIALARACLPHVVRVVRDEASAREAPGIEVLLDAPALRGAPGGTGRLADWVLARRIARSRSLWLAGGLTPENVARAIAEVRPMGVDVASGIERAPGVKDAARMEAFVRAVRGAE